MKDRKLFYPGPGGQHAGLAGGEVLFFSCKFLVPIAKHGFDIKMIGFARQIDNLFGIGFTVGHIGDVGDFLARRDSGYLGGQFP